MDLSFNPQPPTGNPLLDNPIAKDMLTRQMGQQQAPQPQGAVMPPGGAVPPPTIHPSGQVESGPPPTIQPPMPSMPSMTGAPAPAMAPVKAPRGTSAGDQAELSRLENTGSGVSQIAHKIEGTQFGQNHPILGKVLGLGAQIPLQVLDSIAGSASPILRNIERGIPGTEEHHNLLVNQQQQQIGQDVANEEKQAQTGATQAEIPLRGAETAKAQAEADALPGQQAEKQRLEDAQIQNLLHPQAKTAFEDWRATNPNAPTADFFKAQQEAKPDKTENVAQGLQRQLVDAENKGDTATANKLKQQLKDLNPLGEQRVGITIANQGAAQSKATDAKTEKEYTYQRNKWDKDLGTYNSQREKLQEATGFIGQGAIGDALGAVKALSGLASGQGSGVRITQAELNSISKARGYGGDFQVALQKFGDGKNLDPKQEADLKAILADVGNLAARKERVINRVLDDLSNATDTQTIRKIDSQARHALMGAQ